MDRDVRDRANACAVVAEHVDDGKRRVVRQPAPVQRESFGQGRAPGAQRRGHRRRFGPRARREAPGDQRLAVAGRRDPAEQVTARDRARPRVRMDARREDGAACEPERGADRVAHRVGVARRQAEQVAHEQAHRAVFAAQYQRAHFEVVVHLGGRLVVDEAGELHRRRRRDDRGAEARTERHQSTSVRTESCAAEWYAASTTATAARPSAAVTEGARCPAIAASSSASGELVDSGSSTRSRAPSGVNSVSGVRLSRCRLRLCRSRSAGGRAPTTATSSPRSFHDRAASQARGQLRVGLRRRADRCTAPTPRRSRRRSPRTTSMMCTPRSIRQPPPARISNRRTSRPARPIAAGHRARTRRGTP